MGVIGRVRVARDEAGEAGMMPYLIALPPNTNTKNKSNTNTNNYFAILQVCELLKELSTRYLSQLRTGHFMFNYPPPPPNTKPHLPLDSSFKSLFKSLKRHHRR